MVNDKLIVIDLAASRMSNKLTFKINLEKGQKQERKIEKEKNKTEIKKEEKKIIIYTRFQAPNPLCETSCIVSFFHLKKKKSFWFSNFF